MSLDKIITHSRRYKLVAQRMTANHQAISDSGNLTVEQCIDHMKIMEEALEALADIASDYNEIVREKEKVHTAHVNALRIYAKEFGNHVVSERDVPDGIPFELTATILPITKQLMSVDISIRTKEDYEHQHFGRRTRYQKIRDGIILLRQSFRKP